MRTDTIAAIATALTESGIGIIRVSGDDSIEIVNSLFQSVKSNFELKDAKTHTIHYGYIVKDEKKIDEVLVSVMKAPHSYTGENVVEINCHGGILLMKKILSLVIMQGARIAEPGEFTKRAFLSGRLDLSKAEAVMDLISSKNDYAMEASVKQLGGSISTVIDDLRKKIIYEIAYIESALDDPENYSLDEYGESLRKKLEEINSTIDEMISSADNGRIIKEGIQTVIIGKPNAGKSSFLNKLIGEEKAIVTDIAGTTRDILEQQIMIRGINLNMIDTAGIRETNDTVEKIGVERAIDYAGKADLILYIVDSSVSLDEDDDDIIKILHGKNVLVIYNKTDLTPVVSESEIIGKVGIGADALIRISVKDDERLTEFEEKIESMFLKGAVSYNDQVVVTNLRHKEALMEARNSLAMVENSIDSCMSEDFYSVDLMNAYSSLGRIIGEEVDDDLVNEIFEKFCMGK